MGIESLNREIKNALTQNKKSPILSSEGPLWYRGFLRDEESIACAHLSRSLKLLDAKRMVVGHTTQRTGVIAHRCSGALIGIDTGISAHYGKNLSVLEIIAEDAKAIYKGKNTDLPDPF